MDIPAFFFMGAMLMFQPPWGQNSKLGRCDNKHHRCVIFLVVSVLGKGGFLICLLGNGKKVMREKNWIISPEFRLVFCKWGDVSKAYYVNTMNHTSIRLLATSLYHIVYECKLHVCSSLYKPKMCLFAIFIRICFINPWNIDCLRTGSLFHEFIEIIPI